MIHAELENGDVVVVAQKAVSKGEGRVVRLADVEPSAEDIAARRRPRPASGRGDPPRGRARVVRTLPLLVIAEDPDASAATDVAIGAAGIRPLFDLKSERDRSVTSSTQR